MKCSYICPYVLSSARGVNRYAKAAAERKTCVNCGCQSPADLVHYLFDCSHPPTRGAARKIRGKVLSFVLQLCDAAVKACSEAAVTAGIERKPPTPWAMEVNARAERARTAAGAVRARVDSICSTEASFELPASQCSAKCRKRRGTRMSTRGTNRDDPHAHDAASLRQWLTYQLVLAMPFRESDVHPAGEHISLAQLVGALFDSVVLANNELRPLANLWVRWSALQLMTLLSAVMGGHRQAAAALPAPAGGDATAALGGAVDGALPVL